MKITVTGGTGGIGKRVVKALRTKGHEVAVLSRNPKAEGEYFWNIPTNEIDISAVKGSSVILHLAGAPVFDKAWSKSQRKEIESSRVQSAVLLFRTLLENNWSIDRFISASGTGYYANSNSPIDEQGKMGDRFLSQICDKWEEAASNFSEFGADIYIARTGIVMDPESGYIAKLKPLVQNYLASALGSGNQNVAWIHHADLTAMYVAMCEALLKPGTYNAVSPDYISQTELTNLFAKKLGKKVLLPKVPEFALKLVLGERAEELLVDCPCIPKALLEANFSFQYSSFDDCLNDIFS